MLELLNVVKEMYLGPIHFFVGLTILAFFWVIGWSFYRLCRGVWRFVRTRSAS